MQAPFIQGINLSHRGSFFLISAQNKWMQRWVNLWVNLPKNPLQETLSTLLSREALHFPPQTWFANVDLGGFSRTRSNCDLFPSVQALSASSYRCFRILNCSELISYLSYFFPLPNLLWQAWLVGTFEFLMPEGTCTIHDFPETAITPPSTPQILLHKYASIV